MRISIIALTAFLLILFLGCIPLEKTTDTDRDGIPDFEEYKLGTDSENADTDGDGESDGEEVNEGSDPLDPESNSRLVIDELQDYGKNVYIVTSKKASAEKKIITVTYELKDDKGFSPSSNKIGCIQLVDFPQDYEPGLDDLNYYAAFDDSGSVAYVSSSGIVPGKYIYRFCGVYKGKYGSYNDLKEYSGDGDEVSVEIEKPFIVEVIDKKCERFGDVGYECKWWFAFIDGSHGVCGNVRDLKNAYRIHVTTPEHDGYWAQLGCYDDDSIKVKGAISSDWIRMELEWIDDSILQYNGDGDAQTVYK